MGKLGKLWTPLEERCRTDPAAGAATPRGKMAKNPAKRGRNLGAAPAFVGPDETCCPAR